jgi:hypothetical protein
MGGIVDSFMGAWVESLIVMCGMGGILDSYLGVWVESLIVLLVYG